MHVVVVAVTVCELRGPIECARGEVEEGGGGSARLLDRQFQFGWQQQQQQQAGRSVVNLARTDYNKPLSLARTRKTQTQNAHSANATTTKRFARLLLLLYYSYS